MIIPKFKLLDKNIIDKFGDVLTISLYQWIINLQSSYVSNF